MNASVTASYTINCNNGGLAAVFSLSSVTLVLWQMMTGVSFKTDFAVLVVSILLAEYQNGIMIPHGRCHILTFTSSSSSLQVMLISVIYDFFFV